MVSEYHRRDICLFRLHVEWPFRDKVKHGDTISPIFLLDWPAHLSRSFFPEIKLRQINFRLLRQPSTSQVRDHARYAAGCGVSSEACVNCSLSQTPERRANGASRGKNLRRPFSPYEVEKVLIRESHEAGAVRSTRMADRAANTTRR